MHPLSSTVDRIFQNLPRKWRQPSFGAADISQMASLMSGILAFLCGVLLMMCFSTRSNDHRNRILWSFLCTRTRLAVRHYYSTVAVFLKVRNYAFRIALLCFKKIPIIQHG